MIAGLLSACGSSDSVPISDAADSSFDDAKEETKLSAETEGEERISLRAVGFNNVVGHIDSVVAYTAGFYEDEGLDVDFTYNTSNPENTQALLDDKVDIASVGATCVLQYIDQGSDIVIIGGQMSSGETLYVLPENADLYPELSEETLAGKRVGVTRLNTGDVAFRKILKDRGIDLSKIEFVELDSQPTVTQAVLKGEVDLGINFLTFRASAEEQGLVPISQLDADDEWPNYICCRLITTREKLEANRDAYVKAVKANIKAYELIQTDHEAALDAAVKGIENDKEVLKNQLYEYGHLGISPNPDVKNTSEFYQAMVDVGYTSGSVDIKDYIDATVFQDALNELLAEDPDNEVYLALQEEDAATNY